MKKRNIVIIGASLIVIVLVAVSSTTVIYLLLASEGSGDNDDQGDEGDDDLQLMIAVESYEDLSTNCPLVGEIVYFRVPNASADHDLFWQFGDGSSDTGSSVNHVYDFSDVFNVSVRCSHGGEVCVDHMELPVENKDIQHDKVCSDPVVCYDPGENVTSGGSIRIMDGISVPEVNLKMTIKDAVGELQFSIMVDRDNDGFGDDTLHTETKVYIDEEIVVDIDIVKLHMPPPEELPYTLIYEIRARNGECSSWYCTAEITY